MNDEAYAPDRTWPSSDFRPLSDLRPRLVVLLTEAEPEPAYAPSAPGGLAMTRPRGRPPISPEIAARVLELRQTGMGYGTIAERLGIGATSVRRIIGREKARLYSPEGDGGPGT